MDPGFAHRKRPANPYCQSAVFLLRSPGTIWLHEVIIFNACAAEMNSEDNQAAFRNNPEQWVERYGDYLYRYALARVRDPAAAEDLVQETFLAALKGRDSFRGKSSGQTWLTAILKHKIIDYFRRGNRESASEQIETVAGSVKDFFRNNGRWNILPGKWDDNPAEIFQQQEFLQIFYSCLAQLPERLARAFRLREMEGLSTKELCKKMDITATNSWVMLYRARLHLQRCLDVRWFNKPGETNE